MNNLTTLIAALALGVSTAAASADEIEYSWWDFRQACMAPMMTDEPVWAAQHCRWDFLRTAQKEFGSGLVCDPSRVLWIKAHSVWQKIGRGASFEKGVFVVIREAGVCKVVSTESQET